MVLPCASFWVRLDRTTIGGGGGDASEGDDASASGEILAFLALASTASVTESALARDENLQVSPCLFSSLVGDGRFLH